MISAFLNITWELVCSCVGGDPNYVANAYLTFMQAQGEEYTLTEMAEAVWSMTAKVGTYKKTIRRLHFL